jgi:DNA-binding response OmpR family regulator
MTNLKILVIDDDPATCRLLEMVLQMDNYDTTSASIIEGGDVISLLNKERPHILIMDIHLGSQDTLGYARAIRADSEWQHLPVLMTSAIDRRQESLNAGASSFMLKPFNWPEISRVVNQIRNQLLPE